VAGLYSVYKSVWLKFLVYNMLYTLYFILYILVLYRYRGVISTFDFISFILGELLSMLALHFCVGEFVVVLILIAKTVLTTFRRVFVLSYYCRGKFQFELVCHKYHISE